MSDSSNAGRVRTFGRRVTHPGARPGNPQGGGPRHGFVHEGAVGELFPIVLVNALLNVVTLSIYRFWGKTRVRRYLWARTALQGDGLEYTGTGGELFKGFLIVFFVVLLPLGIASTAIEIGFGPESPANIVFGLFSVVLVLFLIGVAVYRARRYRLSRTMWRGVRAGQTGSAAKYGFKYLGFMALLPITLGWSYPWQRMTLMHQMMNNTWFGDRRFEFEGSLGTLYKRFATVWCGTVLVLLVVPIILGLIFNTAETNAAEPHSAAVSGMGTFSIWHWLIVLLIIASPVALVWYRVHEIRYFAECTRFEGLSFTLDATLGSLVWLVVGNQLIVLLTLGFGTPFTQMRTFRYVCDRLEATGEIDFDAVIQSADKGPGTGEGLADAFDVGAV